MGIAAMKFGRALIAGLLLVGFAVPGRAETAREAIAMFLFGQPDPDHIVAKGLYGLDKEDSTVLIAEDDKCRFTVSSPGKSEAIAINFNEVAQIRISIVDNLASAFAAALFPAAKKQTIKKDIFVQIMGTKNAICSKEECVAKRAFIFTDLDQLQRARRAAEYFRGHFCHGRVF